MKAGVWFIEPKDGAQVTSPVKVVMGMKGMAIKPSGKVVKGTGHHHIIINGGPMRKGLVIPTDAKHPHYGKGQTEASLKLAPGDYKLTMQFADGLHRSFGPKWAATISIKVLAREIGAERRQALREARAIVRAFVRICGRSFSGRARALFFCVFDRARRSWCNDAEP